MIILIGRTSGAGKDTFAMFIYDYLKTRGIKGLQVNREGFIDRGYDLCHSFYGWAGFESRVYYTQNPQRKDVFLPLLGMTPRQKLIEISNTLTAYDPSFFYKPIFSDVVNHVKLVPDLRRKREYIASLNFPNTYRVELVSSRAKINEMDDELKDAAFDLTVDNNGTLEDLRDVAVRLCDNIIIPHVKEKLGAT